MEFITIVPVLRHEVIGLLFFFNGHTSAFWRQLIHERPQYFDTHFKWLSGAVLMFLVNSGMSLLGITPGSCRQSKWLVGYIAHHCLVEFTKDWSNSTNSYSMWNTPLTWILPFGMSRSILWLSVEDYYHYIYYVFDGEHLIDTRRKISTICLRHIAMWHIKENPSDYPSRSWWDKYQDTTLSSIWDNIIQHLSSK